MQLDRVDRRIVAILQTEGRISNAALAERVHLSASACLRRVQRLEQDGIIVGYAARLNPSRVGRGTLIYVEISLSTQRIDALSDFEKAVRDCPDVVSCHLLSGGCDYLLRIAVPGTQAYEQVHQQQLSRLPHVAQIRSSFVLRTVCERELDPQEM